MMGDVRRKGVERKVLVLYIAGIMLVYAFIGVLAGIGIKAFQWIVADLTFGIFIHSPTKESTIQLIITLAAVGALCGLISIIIQCLLSRTYEISEKKKSKTWTENEKIQIYYRIKPPNFRNISKNNLIAELSTCGFCEFYDSDHGCEKYGVRGFGVGGAAKTVCDDFKSSFAEDK